MGIRQVRQEILKLQLMQLSMELEKRLRWKRLRLPSLFIEPGVVTGQYKIDLLDYKDVFEKKC